MGYLFCPPPPGLLSSRYATRCTKFHIKTHIHVVHASNHTTVCTVWVSCCCHMYMYVNITLHIRRGPRGGGVVTPPPPALDHQFFLSTNFLTIAKKKEQKELLGIFYGRYVP